MENPFTHIPSVDQILSHLQSEQSRLERRHIKKLIQVEIDNIKSNTKKKKNLKLHRQHLIESICTTVIKQIDALLEPSMIRVVNATGVILHTGLGRAPLGMEEIQQLTSYTTYTNLEISLKTGKRGDRLEHIEEILKILTGCESSVVVNNNAAAVLLVVNTLTRGKSKEIIISRGEQVEIGGSFRLPDMMRNSGAKMVEIGTTNKTHLHDYAQAISDKTAAIFIAHPSNFQVLGFTAKPDLADIVTLAHQNRLPVIFDLGSGALVDMRDYGLDHEPVVDTMHRMGVDIVTFSGDKLLGGPQAGIITGRQEIIKKIKRNSLLRALRCDKLTLALLNSILRKYLNSDTLKETNPTLNLLTRSVRVQKNIASKIKKGITANRNLNAEIVDDFGRIGSGAYPLTEIPACSLKISIKNRPPDKIARQLRLQSVPVIGYIHNDAFRLNMLTVFDEDIEIIIKNLTGLI